MTYQADLEAEMARHGAAIAAILAQAASPAPASPASPAPGVTPAPAPVPAPVARIVRHGEVLTLDGQKWGAQSVSADHSLRVSGDAYRFELRTEDKAVFGGANSQRSELCLPRYLPFGKTMEARFAFSVEPGPVSKRQWLIPFQIHGDDGIGASPNLALDIQPDGRGGEVIRINACSSPGGAFVYRYLAKVPFVRGQTYSVLIRYRDGRGVGDVRDVNVRPKGPGLIYVEIDGVAVVDLPEIATGFAQARATPEGYAYPKFGIYAERRGAPGEAVVVNVTAPAIRILA